jgi:hypothetical protein
MIDDCFEVWWKSSGFCEDVRFEFHVAYSAGWKRALEVDNALKEMTEDGQLWGY